MLDLGCGPGALMHLLHEIGVDVDGIDFAESSRQLATPEVRDRIIDRQRDRPTLKPANAYDLVICREVLEHLTVLQVQQTVENMARMTSRFIYCTTRFHPDARRACSTSRRSSTSTRPTSRCSTRTFCA